MYPSSHRSITGPGNLTRYVSAPGSLITSVVNSVIGNQDEFSTVGSESMMSHRYYNNSGGDSVATESSCKHESYENGERVGTPSSNSGGFLNQVDVGDLNGNGLRGVGSSPLFRHSSSPAGFFNRIMLDNGFSVTRGVGSYSPQAGPSRHGIANGRLKSQLSFTTQDSLSQISEMNESAMDGSSSDDTPGNGGQSYVSGSFTMNQWDDSNTIMFSPPPCKRSKNANGEVVVSLNDIESQTQYGLPRSIEMANVEKLLQMQQDSVPCKIRAKRGFATHPRSIAERERRTRISEKLRKLQELVPNMDKQTSTADMLDLAVQHIKGLQGEVQKLNKDIENCNCGCKKTT
ncbi:hypothetical protein GIB67_042851 [Kingdonia uniflora]|uniref:BHLH domain-containing protein n=1 Tax=Kingdonia uniflora TaxID=39325 RepID=A0A7J7NS87_9MAGN|nr:hypothetical protein GIB67_042851 [Kingdonia uniflora]